VRQKLQRKLKRRDETITKLEEKLLSVEHAQFL